MPELTRRTVSSGLGLSLLAPPASSRAVMRDLSVQAKRDDLALARRVLAESHVGLTWYRAPRAYAADLNALDALARAPGSAETFRWAVSTWIGGLGHGHTTAEPVVPGPGYRLRHLDATAPALPLGVRVIGGRVHVAHDLSPDGRGLEGAEILAINGRATPALVQAMSRALSADGGSTSSRAHQLGPGWRFPDRLAALTGRPDRFDLRLRFADGAERQLRMAAVAGADLPARFAARRGRPLDQFANPLTFERRDTVGVLTLSSFYDGLLPPGSPGFEAILSDIFAGIAADPPTSLILDLRGNAGGSADYAPLVYSYLTDRPFALATPTILRSASLSTLPIAIDPSPDLVAFAGDPMAFVTADPIHGWVLKPEYDTLRYRQHDPQPTAFTGPLTILTDGGSFSATGLLLDLVQHHHRRRGTPFRVAGAPPGIDTGLGWSSGGQTLRFDLPNCGLRLSVPLLGARDHFATARPALRWPDSPLEPHPLDLPGEADAVLARAVTDARSRGPGVPAT